MRQQPRFHHLNIPVPRLLSQRQPVTAVQSGNPAPSPYFSRRQVRDSAPNNGYKHHTLPLGTLPLQ